MTTTDDFVLNVRQISQYAQVDATGAHDRALIQQGGIGGPYKSIAPSDFVGTALELGGWLRLAPDSGIAWNGAALNFSGQTQQFVFSDPVAVPSLNSVGDIFVNGIALANQDWVQGLFDTIIETPTVDSFNGRTGNVQLELPDVLRAGGLPQVNPAMHGVVTAPTPWDLTLSDDRVVTASWVQQVVCRWLTTSPLVQSFNGRTGAVSLIATDVKAALFADAFQARTPTPPPSDESTRIASTEFVALAVDAAKQQVIIEMTGDVQQVLDFLQLNYAPLLSPNLTGIPQAPTAGPGTSTGQIATTAFVMNAVAESVAGVTSFNTRTGNVTFTAQDLSDVGGAFLNNPIFTGTPSGPTATAGTSSTQLATTAFVQQALSAAPGGVSSFNTRTGAITLTLADVTNIGGAPINNTALTGTPTAPTAPLGDNSTRLATTAWVLSEVGAIASGVTTFNGRSGAVALQAADLSGAGGALLAGPTFTGIPSAPTAVPGTNTTQLATTAFVTAAMGAAQGVSSFNNRTGAVTLALTDVTAVGGAPANSPVLTGAPAAPTASPGTATVQIATTAFVQAAIAGFLSSPALTGTPTAPTATSGNNSTQIATTAFVTAALAALPTGGVSSFNGRSGPVLLTFGDVSAVGGAPIASPALTGTPSAPTAPPGTNTQQLATTAFVTAALGGGGVVSSFNTRQGTVTLNASDIISANGATLTSSDAVPTGTLATPGHSLWWDSAHAQLYMRHNGGFVIANSPASAPTAWTAKRQVFTATGTYVPSPGLVSADVECIGGGAGGGSVGAATAWSNGAGGGGSGGYSRRLLTPAQIGASQAVTIGAGGAGGVSNANGGNGGATSLGSLCVANGGLGGGGGNPATQCAAGAGATVTGAVGDIVAAGAPGGGGAQINVSYGVAVGGSGGPSHFGGGGPGLYAAVGVAASNYGAGGSGGMSQAGSGYWNGGAGSPGIVVVTEFCWG